MQVQLHHSARTSVWKRVLLATLCAVTVLAMWPAYSLAQLAPPGVQVNIAAYGKDETDGSDVGWNSPYPNPSFDDDPNRKGLPNARWSGSHNWQGSQLCLAIKGLEAPYPPNNTLAIGYTVGLQGATFEDGLASKTFVLYRFSGVPAQKDITQCFGVRAGVSTAPAPPAVTPPGPAAEISLLFPRDSTAGFREVHTRGTAGKWQPDVNGLVGTIPNDEGWSFFLSGNTPPRQSIRVSSTFQFTQSVDYNAAGVALVSPASTNTTSTNLRCELSERENNIGVGGWINGSGGPSLDGGVGKALGRDIQLNTTYTVALELDDTTARCLLNGETVVTAKMPSIASLPAQMSPAMFIIEATARFSNFSAGPLAAAQPPASAPTGGGAGPISLAWLDFGKDRVGAGGNPDPDGQGDGHFQVTLDVSGARTVEVITLYSSDNAGNPASGQVWNTAPDGNWILGVYRDSKRLNSQDTKLSDLASGRVTYEIFANDSGYFKTGQYFGVTVRFSDGAEVKAVTQASATPAAAPVSGPAASPAPPPTITGAPGPAPRPTDAMLVADERAVAANGTVTVPIRLEKASRLGSLNFTLRYDPLVLKVNRAEAGDLARGGLFQANTRDAGIIRFGIAVQGTEGITGGGPLAHVEFTAIGARGGRSELTILDVLPADTAGTRLGVNLRNGRVNIQDKLKGDYDGDGRLTAKDALAALKMSVGDLPQDLNLDMDNDNRVSAEDARRILGSALSSPTDASLPSVRETTPPVASPIGSPPTPGPTTQIVKPSEGAKLTFTGTGTPLDGLILYLPPRAIQGEAPVTLQVSAVAPPPSLHTLPVGRLDSLLTAVGPTVRIKPDFAPTLDRPAEVTIPFDRSLVPAGFDPKRLSILVISEKDGRPIYELIKDTKVNPQSGDITFQLSHFTELTGLAEEGLEDLAKSVILGALGEVGGVADDIGGLVIDPIISYFTTPDERALDAAFKKFIEGAGSIAFPELGLAIKLGKVTIGGVVYTVEAAIEAARQQKLEGTVFGARPFFSSLFGTDIIVANPFWDMNVLKTKGITDDTIGDLVKNEQQLQELWSLYKNQLIGGPMGLSQSSRMEVDERLREAWPYLQKYWQAKRLASEKDRVRLAFERRAREVAKKLRERKEATPPPQPQRPVFKLKGVKVSDFTLTDGYKWVTLPKLTADGATWSFTTPAEGAANAKLTLTWSKAPQTIESGKDTVLSVTPSSTITPGREDFFYAALSGGFRANPTTGVPLEWIQSSENLQGTGVTGKVTCKILQGGQRCDPYPGRAFVGIQKTSDSFPVTAFEIAQTLPATSQISLGREITLSIEVVAVLDASGRDPQRPNCCFWKSTYKGKVEWTYRAEQP